MAKLKELILVSLGKESCFKRNPTDAEWADLFAQAKSQALIGVLYQGVESLPPDQQPPKHILEEWSELATIVRDFYFLQEERGSELEGILDKLGLHGCVLKGVGLARLYPVPSARQCGDIDVLVEGTRRSILKKLKLEHLVWDILYQECKVLFFNDVLVEVHFCPLRMFNPFCNARLQRWFKKNSPVSSGVTLAFPGAGFNAVLCMAHTFRHYLMGGVGLRQILDYFYVLRNLNAADKAEVIKILKRTGMWRFAGAMMYVLKNVFRLEDEFLLCSPDNKYGSLLLEDILRKGNFGEMCPENLPDAESNVFERFIRKNRLVMQKFPEYPRQIIWYPFSRICHFLWRKFCIKATS